MYDQVDPAKEGNINSKSCHKKSKLHGALMLLCCFLPIAALVFFNYRGSTGTSIGQVVPYLMILICPLSHILMMAFMRDGKGKCH